MRNAADRKEVRRAEKSAARAERNRGEVLQQIASTTAGRQYLWELLEAAHIFSTPYSPDTNQTYFNLGEQNAGLRLLSDITKFCPEEFINAMREANARRTEHDATADTAPRDPAAERPGDEESGRQLEGSAEYDPIRSEES